MAKWKLPKNVTDKIGEARGELDAALTDLRSEFDQMPETWQDGDKGGDVSAWLDDLDELREDMENIDSEPPG